MSTPKKIKQILLLTGLIALVFVIFVPITRATEYSPEGDPYVIPGSILGTKPSVVSRDMMLPSKLENEAPWSDGLSIVPGIINPPPIVNRDDPTAFDEQANDYEQQISAMTKVINELENSRIDADKIASRWAIPRTATGSWVFDHQPGNIHYNRRRIEIIDRMLVDAREKLLVLQNNQSAAKKKAASLRATIALTSGDESLIESTTLQAREAEENLRATRIELQEEIAKNKALNDAECWPGGSLTPDIGNCILIGTGWVGNIITWVFSLVLWIASKAFDLSVYISISLIGSWFNMPAVATVWRLARDLANIGFIFVLLYIALGTVFEMSGITGNAQKLVLNVIIVALLVNFSGFFVRVIVDSSNIIAYEFYTKLGGGGLEVQTIGTSLVKKMGLGNYFIQESTLAKANINADQNFTPPTVGRLNFISIIGQTFGNIIIILATSFVLFAAAIMFLIRTISLLFLYLVSPIAFVSRMSPSGKFNYFQTWMDKLIHQAFFAPAFLIPLYFVFILLGENGITGLMVGGGLPILLVINIFIIGLLMGCIFIANSFGAAGAKLATSWAGSATLLGTKGITRTSKFIGKPLAKYGGQAISSTARRTSGWANRELTRASGDTWGRRIYNSPGIGIAGAVRAVEGVGRGVGTGGKFIWNSDISKQTKESIKKSEFGKKVGSVVKNPLLAASDTVAGLESAIKSGGGGSFSFLGRTSSERIDAKKKEKEQKEEDKKKEIKDKGDELKDITSEADAWAILKTMTNEEIKQLESSVLTNSFVARSFNKSNLEALEKGGKLTEGDKDAIKTAITTLPPPANHANSNSGYKYMIAGTGSTMW